MSSVFDSQAFNANLFFPRGDTGSTPDNCDEIQVKVAPETSIHVRRHPSSEARFSLLFFHGNGEIVSDYDNFAEIFNSMGAELVIADFRGYGRSTGSPTLRASLEDAHKIYDELKSNGKLKEKVCIMGRSLGSAPTLELCAKRSDVAGCVLESGYADPIPLVERRGLKIDKTTPDEDEVFNNSQKIRSVKCPLLIMHGSDDFLISPHEAKLNYDNAGSKLKHLEILEGVGHNDMMMNPSYFSTLKQFFDSL
ncbi:MAG: alpha/beta fold hydrolase [Nitrospina sp.]|jgi:alpha-beta hydrolase superfamily lysophospholipase|nr:alpha/beta fold hydrolase [Nitrospina sp.]MBT5633686.1 alpha/beta fold hydrolase [Nitrospina sp.]